MDEKKEFLTARGYAIRSRKKNNLTASMEDYLEMIYRLSTEKGYTRVNDIATSLNVQASSVTKMVQKLDEKGFLRYEKYGIIRLTEKGNKTGEYLLNRHNTLYEFLKIIGVKNNLHEDVEGIEHNISATTMRYITSLVNFLKNNPHILKSLQEYQIKNLPRE